MDNMDNRTYSPAAYQPQPDEDDYPLDAEIIERLTRIETRLCKLIVALGHEQILQPKD